MKRINGKNYDTKTTNYNKKRSGTLVDIWDSNYTATMNKEAYALMTKFNFERSYGSCLSTVRYQHFFQGTHRIYHVICSKYTDEIKNFIQLYLSVGVYVKLWIGDVTHRIKSPLNLRKFDIFLVKFACEDNKGSKDYEVIKTARATLKKKWMHRVYNVIKYSTLTEHINAIKLAKWEQQEEDNISEDLTSAYALLTHPDLVNTQYSANYADLDAVRRNIDMYAKLYDTTNTIVDSKVLEATDYKFPKEVYNRLGHRNYSGSGSSETIFDGERADQNIMKAGVNYFRKLRANDLLGNLQTLINQDLHLRATQQLVELDSDSNDYFSYEMPSNLDGLTKYTLCPICNRTVSVNLEQCDYCDTINEYYRPEGKVYYDYENSEDDYADYIEEDPINPEDYTEEYEDEDTEDEE